MTTKKNTLVSEQEKEAVEETRYIVVFPQVNYNARVQPGQPQPVHEPTCTKQELLERLPALMQTGQFGNNFRVYEVNKFVPVEVKVSLDGELLSENPLLKKANKPEGNFGVVPVVLDPNARNEYDYADDDDEYGYVDEEDY